MAVSALPAVLAVRVSRRALTVAITLLVLSLGLGIGLYSSRGTAASGALSRLAEAAANQVGQSVASIFSGRSPGLRPKGTLTNLKHKRGIALHERALPKIRTAPPSNELAKLVSPPAATPTVVPPIATPLVSSLAEAPTLLPAIAQTGPIIFPAFTPLPGGSIVPPIGTQTPPTVTPIVTPPPPQAPSVPEPSSWAMLLLGFGMIGWMLRRDDRSRLIFN